MIGKWRRPILSMQIKFKRTVMYKKAKNFGYTHPDVVACSQDLDRLLNRYQRLA